MNSEGRRIDLIQRILNSKRKLKFIDKGTHQEVFSIGGGYVVKRFLLGKKHFGPDDWYDESGQAKRGKFEEAKTRFDLHLNFVHQFFGDLIFKPRVFIDEVESDEKVDVAIYQLEQNLKTFRNPEYGRFGVNYSLPEFDKLRKIMESKSSLMNDFKKFYEGWKKLKEFGLSLDVTQKTNICLYFDKQGKARLKIYDVIPLILEDKEKLETTTKVSDEIKKGLIVYQKAAHIGETPSDKFFTRLSIWFDY